MTDVVIAGIGQTPVGENYDISLRVLAHQAIEAAIADAGGLMPQAMYVGNMLSPVASHQANLGALLVDFSGLGGIEATTTEAAGASGGAALRLATMAIASGMVDSAIVVGVEKYTDLLGPEAEAAVSQMTDSDYEGIYGVTPTAQSALLMQRYLHEFNVEHNCFAGFAMVAHANGANNPNAMFRRAIRQEAYEQAEPVADPLNMFDVAPYADGAAALVLARADRVPGHLAHPLVRVSGASIVVDTLALHDRPDPLAWYAAGFSVERACRQAGILPADVDLFEYFDASSIFAALSLEAAGFAPRGQGWRLAQSGELSLNGRLPVATMGGLKARGNPIGATGVYQAVEAAQQLRGVAGKNQVPDARRALIQCLGGPAATAVTHVLERIG